ncbi:MAG TPA: FTR1 family protein [Polyangia bacterium]|jgi:high-affinity iron transporter|nr:FTR1 family protein [Polyangia bacterium]
MLQALLVTFREGIESFLIVGVVIAYLKKSQRPGLVRGVKIGLGISLVTCTAGAWLWLQVPNQPLYEGIAALTAAVVVGLLLVQMLHAGRHMRAEIEARVDRMTGQGEAGTAPSFRAIAGVALVTALLVTREGLEAVFFLGVQALALRAAEVRSQAVLVVAGAVLGLICAAIVAWGWTRYGRRLNLGVILKVTALFLGLFLLQLMIYGIHELAESGVITGTQAFHDATEVFGPDGRIGHALSYSLLGAPLLYLFWARRATAARGPAATT